MNIHGIGISNFFSHKETTLRLPERGVILVTGDNGAGKSALVEAPAWGFWGKTLRSTAPWNGDGKPPCAVVVSADNVSAERKRAAGKSTTLTWMHTDPAAAECDEEYETPTKAQQALEAEIGGYELWRKSHVFSSSDAAHFTLATDGERKRLIESFLGTTRFDAAVEKCRADLKAARTKLEECNRRKEKIEVSLQAAQRALSDSKKALAACKAPDDVAISGPARHDDHFDEKIEALQIEIREKRNAIREADKAGAGWDVKAREKRTLLNNLSAHANCPTCTQAIPKKLLESLKVDVAEATGRLQLARDKAQKALGDTEEELAELEDELKAFQKKRSDLIALNIKTAHVKRAHESYAKQRALFEKARKDAEAIIFSTQEQAAALVADLESATTDVTELEVCETVLGLKGVRAHILSESLSGIESVTNAWLARLGGKISVKLAPYSEHGNGSISDAISLEVVGAGDGKGYRASSQGERRRVDVALLLGLGEVAAAARGRESGTLFFDEVLDALDPPGIDCVIETVVELAQERCVIVITHSPELQQRIRRHATMCLEVAHGTVTTYGGST